MSAGVLGVDFSGASAAGEALWVTEATQTPVGVRIEECYRAADRWGRDRGDAHAGLVDRITAADVRTVGLDFPFSLPQTLLDAQCGGEWSGFLSWVASEGGPADPAAFSDACRHTAEMIAGKRDIRRETDARRGALCPYTNRVRSMTYHGARDVLGRLAERADTAVVPMQDGTGAATSVCEVYPAATFGWLGAYREGYKNTDGARARREANVAAIEDCSVALAGHRETYLANHDALDSLAAAVSAARVDDGARPTPAGTREEGCIHV
ncbi:DUF429 domain-containing protein [Haloarcula sp. S1CR25-12]|uniref:DUF429 domain-containing protein n=1 Tax=Haloarcula saliterrae TaxID=2950534 RepID=A0ABU2F6K8_9EURY|nr:DUF429 domain-containing protein [Haloarcula sp. S1CR25-12]MDS0257910.1 DUF429 domain-containing protein [Haloarcula sp. S1CR25-12]